MNTFETLQESAQHAAWQDLTADAIPQRGPNRLLDAVAPGILDIAAAFGKYTPTKPIFPEIAENNEIPRASVIEMLAQ
jgi:hypothetical protein